MNNYVKFHRDKIANFENSVQYLFALGPSLWTYVQSINHVGVKDLKWSILGWPKDTHNKYIYKWIYNTWHKVDEMPL
jgi:hypothetical protein